MTDAPQLISVRFRAPVEGIDLSDGDVFLSTRHRVAAVYLRQDRAETLFINDEGEVVARWATRLIERIEWPDEAKEAPAVEASVGTLQWRKEVQERHPQAYQRWTADEDAELTEEFHNGMQVAQIADRHQRRRGGITARLVRLGLIAADTPEREIGRQPATSPGVPPAAPDLLRPSRVPTAPPATPPRQQPATIIEVTDDVCRHDIALGTCSICKYDGRPSVYITAGGVRFHSQPECPALLEGQRHVDARGGTTEPIEMVHRGSGRLEGRDPCLTCTPD